MNKINRTTREYLKSYFKLENPGFAVLISAPWGAGKTKLIEQLIAELAREQGSHSPLYVSLFGVTNMNDVNRSIMRAMLPSIEANSTKYLNQFKNFVSGIRAFGFSLDLSKVDLTEVILSKLPETLIFDDLERTKMSNTELLGAINFFTEQQSKRVVLLAYEDRLWEGDDHSQKEKVVGQTLKIVPDFEAAFKVFLEELGDKTTEFLKENVGIVKSVFESANYGNLRSLRQAIWEFDRFFRILAKDLVEKTDEMQRMLGLFLALTLELKNGNFTREDFELRGGIGTGLDPKYEKLKLAKGKYSLEEVQYGRYNSVLPSGLATRIICDGFNDSEEINQTLRQTPAFHEPDKEQEWQTVWYAFDRDEDQVRQAVEEMEEKFHNLKYLDPGIVLHVLSTRLNLKLMGFSNKSLAELADECEQYIAKLKAARQLEAYDPFKLDGFDSGFGYSETGYLGMGYPKQESDPSTKIFRNLFEQMQKAQRDVYDELGLQEAAKLLELLRVDTSQFAKKISSDHYYEATFSHKPILKFIEPKEFAECVLTIDHKQRKIALKAIEKRYRKPGDDLVSEREWLALVNDELIKAAAAKSDFNRWQIENDLNHSIAKTLSEWAIE